MPYRFQSGELVATACSPWPASDAVAAGSHSGELYKGISICEVLHRGYAHGNKLSVVPNWQCSSKDQPCRWPWPFETSTAADGAGEALAFDVGAIALQDVQCFPASYEDGSEYSRVSAVFQALPPRSIGSRRQCETSWTTCRSRLRACGRPRQGRPAWWGASAVGGTRATTVCVCLYIPRTFSITRSSIMLGRITSINAGGDDDEETHRPVLLELRVPPVRLWGLSKALRFRMAYNYTVVKQAGEFLRRSGSAFSTGRDMVAKSLFLSYPYPKKDTTGGDQVTSLFRLGDELMLWFTAVPALFPSGSIERPVLLLEMLSVEQAVGPIAPRSFWHGSLSMAASQPSKEPAAAAGAGTGWRPLLNVSAELRIFGKPFGWTTALSLEGVYDPEDGRMFLIGCRNVGVPESNVSTSRAEADLEEGMDCSIKVKVKYPPTTTHWLISSTAKVHITTTRSAGDPLYFAAVRLEAWPVMYSQGIINAVLRVVVLTALSQLRHLKSHADVAPHVSHAMLAVQIVGYGVRLITGFEAAGTDDLYRAVDLTARALVLAALLLTLWINEMVGQSRAWMLARSPLEPWRVPSDRKVLVYNCGAPLVAPALGTNGQAISTEQLAAVMHDLFLLPQLIGNAVWRVNCKPPRESYYLGVTAARLLPHAYDYLRPPAPVVDPYSNQYSGHEYFHMPKPVDLVVPLFGMVLALDVYMQQRWNFAIANKTRKVEQ
ncbi:hypothetical protein HU200_051726 [Digitaria exilis]|uniref:RING-type E3 ubiquitin transferase n=1 Tax=Digitaria exilis TaxID=1010633 RepID=A0A835AV83_9POAL|nr:hypothetical protein HU200_051726 [Digitaria exilis]